MTTSKNPASQNEAGAFGAMNDNAEPRPIAMTAIPDAPTSPRIGQAVPRQPPRTPLCG